MEKEMSLRAEFEEEVKSKVKNNSVELLFETDSTKYIAWLEQKIKALSEPVECNGEVCEICKENEAKVVTKHCRRCEDYVINRH